MTEMLLEDVDLTELSRLLEKDGFSFDQPERIPRAGPGPVEASLAQGRLWYLSQLRPDDWSYNLVAAFRVSQTIDHRRVEQSFARVLERHDALNTTISESEGKPVLCPLSDPQVQLHHHQIEASGPQDIEVALATALKAEARRPFDLAKERPLRLVWIDGGGQVEPLLIIVVHHIAADGWSVPIVIRDFLTAYEQGGRQPLPPLPIGYRDFAAWQHGLAHQNGFAKSLAYWTDRLAECPTHVDFPFDLDKTGAQRTSQAAREVFEVPRPLVDGLAGQLNVAPYAVLITLYAFLVARYSGTKDLLIAASAAGRERPELEQIVGLFANTVPHRFKLDYALGFRDNVARTAPTLLDDLDHQDAPFEQIVANRLGERGADGDPLCQIAFVLQNYPSASALSQVSGFRPVPLPIAATRYELSLVAEVDAKSYKMTLFSREGAMSVPFARGFADRFLSVLQGFADGAQTPLGSTNLLTDVERAALTARQASAKDLPDVSCALHDQIRAVAVANPDACAIETPTERVSYRELISRADQMAARLALGDVAEGAVVAVCLPRSAESVAAALAAMSVGAAFLLLDPTLPTNRLRFLESDAGASVTITNAATLDGMDWVPSKPIVLGEEDTTQNSFDYIARPYDPEAAAYVVYTSGSTGWPKGAVVPQRGIQNFLMGLQDLYPLTSDDRVLHKAPASFDVAIWEMLWPLCAGARVVIALSGQEADVQALADLVQRHGVTVTHFVPAMLTTFLDGLAEGQTCDSLRLVFAGGDALPPQLILDHDARLAAQLVNSYGPCETSIGVTHWACDDPFDGPITPIGDAMPGVGLRILDRHGNDVPDGVPGELVVSGPSVGLGYLGQPDLTRDAFRTGPTHDPVMSYATGDMVRRDAQGRVLFLGRLDNQIKLRGQRIELGEVEAALTRLYGVGQAVAFVPKDGRDAGGRLLAAVVRVGDTDLAEGDLKSALAQELPDTMIPARIGIVEQMPVTANGKIDRQGLLAACEPGQPRAEAQAFSEMEGKVSAIFLELLGTAPTRRDDDFFQMGGHSLLAIQALTQIQRQLDVRVSLPQFLANPTLGALADHICAHATVPTGAVQVLREAQQDHPTLVLLHPALGITTCYLAISAALPPDWGIILVEDEGTSDAAGATLQDRAGHYAVLVRDVFPDGDIILGGWSMGGLLACAIEQALLTTGHHCSQLLLIDSHLHQDGDQHAQTDRIGFLRAMGLDAGRAADLLLQTADLDDDGALSLVAEHLGGGSPNLHDLAHIYRRNAKAAQGFRPVATSTPAVCVIANGYSDALQMRQRWGSVLENCTFLEIDEDHEGIIRRPAVDQIATELRKHTKLS